MTTTDEQKWMFLHQAPHRDALNPEIKRLSRLLWDAADRNLRRFAELCHTVARDWIHQLPDTDRLGREDISGFTREPMPDDAIDALQRGFDDCDAKARLFVALCIASGQNARMVPYWRGADGKLTPWGTDRGKLDHVAAELFYNGRWIPVETTLARARLGETGDQVPKDANGKWKLS